MSEAYLLFESDQQIFIHSPAGKTGAIKMKNGRLSHGLAFEFLIAGHFGASLVSV
jgi:hypothetical protein